MKNKSMIFEIVKKELLDIIRDKKTLIMMIIIPIILLPILMTFILIMQDSRMNIDESEYNTIGFTFELDNTLKAIIEELGIQKEVGTKEELEERLNNSEINAYITLEYNNFTIYYSENNSYGQSTLNLAYELIENYKKIIQFNMLATEGIDPNEIFNVYTINIEDISERNVIGEMPLEMIPTFVLMMSTLTAIFTAIDMTAGEKERGTLETLLSFPLNSKDIIYGKFLATTLCTAISSILSFISMYAVLCLSSQKLETLKELKILSIQNIILIIIIFVFYAMLISAIVIVIASKSKSFKEAQNSTQPLAFITIIPMLIDALGIKLDFNLALIPFINVGLITSDIISNTVNMNYFALTILSNLICTAIILKAIIKLYKSDKILFT